MEINANPPHNFVFDATKTMYPSRLRVIREHSCDLELENGTIYGVVICGARKVSSGGFASELPHGGFFACRDSAHIEGDGVVVVFERLGFLGIPMSGVFEEAGRLSYIDGCSSSILVMPPRSGDPVLNHLHFPPGVLQSEHVHPSIRFGAVVSGAGVAFGARPDGSATWEQSLTPGAVFYLPAMQRHAFKTVNQSEPLNIISFHPESDWGPTDESHPMLSRTYRSGR